MKNVGIETCDFSQNTILPNLMETIESVQYSAGLAVTGTWRVTSREKLYTELGWDSLSSRRWSRHLTLFYKFVHNLAPKYTLDPITPLHQSQYYLGNQGVIGQLDARTEKFKLSFYPNCLSEWNKLEPELRLAPSFAVFKKNLVNNPPPAKSVYGIHDQKGFSYLTQFRVGLRKLNFYKFKHNFKDTVNPICPTSDGIEDTEHFLLLCPSFNIQRQDLLAGIVELLRSFVLITDLSNDALT